MVDVAQRQRTTFPTLDNAVDAAAKYRSDYDRANTEYNRFHARSDPAAQLAEQAAYADPSRMNPTFVNARNPRVFRNTQYSPNYPGDKYTTQFTVGSSGGTGGLESLPRGEYYNRMKDTYDFLMNEMYKPDVRRDMNLEPYPDENNVEAIPATSYLDPTADDYFLRELYNKLTGNYDIENDELNYKGVAPEIYDMDEALKIDEERSSREFNKFQEKFEPVIQTQSRYDYEDLIEQGVDPMEGIFQDYMPYPGGGFMGRNRYVKPEPELVAGMDDSWQYLQQQMDELDPDGPNYDDMLEMLMNDMEMKYPYMVG